MEPDEKESQQIEEMADEGSTKQPEDNTESEMSTEQQTEETKEDISSPAGSDDTEKSDTQKEDKDVFMQPAPPELTAREKIIQEEAKAKMKYPGLGRKGAPSKLLQKRLIGAQKFFDSGDYQMARQKVILPESLGDAIPTPEDLPPRKPSITTSKLAQNSLS